MKIVISPSKTQRRIEIEGGYKQLPFFEQQAVELAGIAASLDREQLGQAFGLKGKLLDQTLETYAGFYEGSRTRPLEVYTGQVYQQLPPLEDCRHYFEEHLLILSALYGVIRAQDGIRNYRLDFKTKLLKGQSLYAYWKPHLASYFNSDELVINLASAEFAKMVPVEMVDIVFKERTESGDKVIATYSKMARGLMLGHMARVCATSLEDLKTFSEAGYRFDPDHSSDKVLVFVR